MIRKLVTMSATVLTALLVCAASASAQSVDIAGGYAWLHEESLTVPGGWFGAVAANLNDSFGIFGQVSGHSKTVNTFGVDVDTKLFIYGAGPRFSTNQRSGVTFFVQALLGAAKSTASVSGSGTNQFEDTNFAVQPAAGVDLKAGGHAGIRLQAGETFIKASGDTQKEFTFMGGIVIRIG